MTKGKVFYSLLSAVIFSVVMLQQTPADAADAKVYPDLMWLQDTLETNFALYKESGIVIGIEVYNLGGELQYTLTEDDIILQAGTTTFLMGNANTIWADFRAEVEAAQAGSGRLDLIVKDKNTGKIVAVRVYI